MSSTMEITVKDSSSAPAVDALDSEVDRRILIVDDEEMVRSMFADFLSTHYVCTTAASSDEALAELALMPYALVISDMQMPGRNGVELLREIRRFYPDTAVIMVSAISRSQRIRDALQVGAFDYLIKPCELEVLLLSVERALERRALTITARQYRHDLERQNEELAARKADLERLQAQIVHSEKMASLGQLSAGIAHELNNPAAFIYANMELLQEYLDRLEQILAVYDEAKLPAEIQDEGTATKTKWRYETLLPDIRSMVADVREGAERIRDVVQNLRLFSRLDEAEFKRVDLHENLDSTLRLLSHYYGSIGRVRLTKNYGDIPPVNCYASQLNQVWTNLLVNAAQALKGDGQVDITTLQEGENVVVEISDSGCGISQEDLSKIFDPFFTTKSVGEGTGLGLSITYGIIEKHGGTIEVKSEVGVGTKFTVKIPLDPDVSKKSGTNNSGEVAANLEV